MKILLDTNVVLDLLLDREPIAGSAREIFVRIEKGEWRGYLGATTITTMHYLVAKAVGRKRADEVVADLLRLFAIVPVDRDVLLAAIQSNGSDFEESVLYTGALFEGLDMIVTRDKRGFANAKVAVVTPEELLQNQEKR
ncbi:type II toxin-antitoxin system VapC family toxin [Hydrogenimonas sp.]